MTVSTNMGSLLKKRLNPEAFEIINSWIQQFEVEVICSKPRASKLGDYRTPTKSHGHRITINNNLNPYAFIITLVHEMAHLKTWVKFKRTAKPHGPEWKKEFQNLMQEFAPLNLFPAEVESALATYLTNPKASSCSDYHLSKTLMLFDAVDSALCTVEAIPEKTLFKSSSGRIFRKEVKLRKRYKCLDINTNRRYLFNPLALVSRI